MKERMLILVGLLAFGAIVARADGDFRCRTLPSASGDTNLATRISMDLLSGVWTQVADYTASDLDLQSMIQFSSTGEVRFTNRATTGDFVTQSMFWEVTIENSQPLLVLQGNQPETTIYRVDQTCDGILLTNTKDGKQLVFKHNVPAAAKELNRLQNGLVGSWSNTMYPFDPPVAGNSRGQVADAFLNYELQANGDFTKSLGGDRITLRETGSWEVSQCGKFLLLHATRMVNGRQQLVTEMARLKYLQLDELVLEHALKSENKQFCTNKKDFFFFKV